MSSHPTQSQRRSTYSQDIQTSLSLSFAAYCGILETNDASLRRELQGVLKRLSLTATQELVWGPAARIVENALVTDALMYVVREHKHSGTGSEETYTIVIRGTNPFSIRTWLFQDFQSEAPLFDWHTLSPDSLSPKGAKVSIGSAITMQILGDLKSASPSTKTPQSLIEFLRSRVENSRKSTQSAGKSKLHLRFTGHSLGGMAAPTLGLLVKEKLQTEFPDLEQHAAFSAVAFAGPTAGNRAFAQYSSTQLDDCKRYINPLDFVPNAWVEKDMLGVYGKYADQYDKRLTRILLDSAVKGFLDKVVGKGLGYTQVGRAHRLKANFKMLPFPVMQAAYQHVFPYLTDILGLYSDDLNCLLSEIVWSLVEADSFLDKIIEVDQELMAHIPGLKWLKRSSVFALHKAVDYRPALLT